MNPTEVVVCVVVFVAMAMQVVLGQWRDDQAGDWLEGGHH